VELTPAARTRLARRGLDPLNGARPLARLIQEELKQPLGEEILFGSLENGGTVEVDAAEDTEGFVFRFPEADPNEESTPQAEPTPLP
jgi:ATP-dependent Clp protease ATP-binding subunit ClpA